MREMIRRIILRLLGLEMLRLTIGGHSVMIKELNAKIEELQVDHSRRYKAKKRAAHAAMMAEKDTRE